MQKIGFSASWPLGKIAFWKIILNLNCPLISSGQFCLISFVISVAFVLTTIF